MDNQFQIESGIPIPAFHSDLPANRERAKVLVRRPYGAMMIGDSFLVPDVRTLRERNNVCSSACNFGKRNNMEFTVRSVGGDLRVWRVK